MKIKITHSTKYALVDSEDFARCALYNWIFNRGYVVTHIQNRQYNLARIVLNDFESDQIDHKDGDKLNNQKYNLRVATSSQNNMNKIKVDRFKPCSSVYKGVSWNKEDKRWKAQIKLNGKMIYLGYFKDELEAANAYNKAALKYHGEFANLNKIVQMEVLQ